jgi:nicotinate (nicotinamide) nucleotide adenylyltransferase
MTTLPDLQQAIHERFEATFGRTPLPERIQDILSQATALGRYTDLVHLRDEAGDLLCSVLQLCSECGWAPADLVAATLRKIEQRGEQYARLGRKLRVAILGGAFDPVNVGHVEVAREVLRLGSVDEVWLMPCFEHLSGKKMAPAEDRIEMCRLAVRGERGLGVFDYEVRHRFRGETYHSIKKLLAEEIARNQCEFSFVIGQDNADNFSSWSNAERLERMIRFIVLPREGQKAPSLSAWYLKPPHAFLHDARQVQATSSTEVRRLLREESCAVERLLNPDVLDYVRSRNLYPAPVDAAVPLRRVALFTGSFDPPSLFHRNVAERLLQEGFDEVVIWPTGRPPGRNEAEHASSVHRAHMVDLTFRRLANVQVDPTDLDDGTFTNPCDMEHRYASHGQVWHVIADDFIAGSQAGRCIIQSQWTDGASLWARSRFVVLHPPGAIPAVSDLPSHHLLLAADRHVPTADLRGRVYRGEPIDGLVSPAVAGYIRRHGLFTATVPGRVTYLRVNEPRLLIALDERNERSRQLAERYRRFESDDPNLILVLGGDGSMLHAIREHWRRRLPFFGINTGHLGFLLNERAPADLAGAELVVYRMPMLRVDTETPDGQRQRGLAYNDAWMEREVGQAAWLRLDVDGQTRVDKVVGDGVLVATPSGTSAYARSMGATPVPLGSPVLTLAGSNILRPRFWKPVALPDTAVVKLTSLDRSGKRPVRCFVGGWPAGVVQSMEARVSGVAAVELAFNPEFDPSTRLLRSLFPPNEEGV